MFHHSRISRNFAIMSKSNFDASKQMNGLSKKFGLAMQWAKKKTGNAETNEDPEYKEFLAYYKNEKFLSERLCAAAEAYEKALQNERNTREVFAKALEEFSESCEEQNGMEFKYFAETLRKPEESLEWAVNEFRALAVEPLQHMNDQTIPLKKQYDKLRLKYDSMEKSVNKQRQKLNGGPNLVKAESDLLKYKNELDQVKQRLQEKVEERRENPFFSSAGQLTTIMPQAYYAAAQAFQS
eukprot:926028_1